MMHLNLNVRVNHSVFGVGTVEGIDRNKRNKSLLRIRFDRDKKVRYFCAQRESFIAEMQEAFGER